MFVDIATITVQAGHGGHGAVSFHREKYISAGGPDGGDGGNGGDVILRADDHMNTLLDFRYKRKFVAENGDNGGPKTQSGSRGSSLVIRVPRGTLVRDAATNGILRDLSDGADYIVAKGGSGGWGNRHYATPTRQAPRFAKNGLPGESREIVLELKLLADVGLVGFPNVGKSTLLSVVSAARPKIANYHFTTLQPNLGVVRIDDDMTFVVADIPGIIEGAADGAGLGHDFLRHVDRCRLLLHIIDASESEGRDVIADIEAINAELSGWSEKLASRPQIIVANKLDIAETDAPQRLRAYAEERGLPYFEISAATHQGVEALLYKAAELLRALPPIEIYEPDYIAPPPAPDLPEDTEITVTDDGIYVMEGAWLRRISGGVNLDDYESRMWFERTLRGAKLFKRLEKLGIKEGDTVSIYDIEFEYVE